jgi:DnaJ-class molecular chaperone
MELHPDRFPTEMKAEAEKEQLKINSAYQIIEKFLKKAGTYSPSSAPGKTESHSQSGPPKDTFRREKTP